MSDLTRGGVFGPRPDPHPELLAMETTREPQAAPDAPELVPVYLTSGTRTSGGTGPGVVRVSPDEAGRLVADRRGVYGDSPPKGFEDGGADTRNVGLMMPRTERR